MVKDRPRSYGSVLMASGSYAYDNPFGFSTKYGDGETALVYYGYRYYAPGTGRWTRRDPVWEKSVVAVLSHTSVQEEMLFSEEEQALLAIAARKDVFLASRLRVRIISKRHWLRPPILYTFVENGPVQRFDKIGLLTFKVYGNYCGPGRCAGAPMSERACWCTRAYRTVPHIDHIDECCRIHDVCLGSKAGWQCDERICTCLSAL